LAELRQKYIKEQNEQNIEQNRYSLGQHRYSKPLLMRVSSDSIKHLYDNTTTEDQLTSNFESV